MDGDYIGGHAIATVHDEMEGAKANAALIATAVNAYDANQATIARMREALSIAQDHIGQYRQYSEEMRKIGRGFNPSSEFSPEYAEQIFRAALEG